MVEDVTMKLHWSDPAQKNASSPDERIRESGTDSNTVSLYEHLKASAPGGIIKCLLGVRVLRVW